MERTSGTLNVVLIYLVLALATIFAFEPVRHNDFLNYDDDEYITDNPHVNGGITRESVVWAFTTFTTPRVGHWQPLTWLSHMLDCELFGLNPLWHHLTNLWFHIANTLLLFWVLKRMTGAIWPSAFVAAAFALHPLHVESVAWVTERRDVLSSLFWMLTMAAYVRYAQRPGIGRYLPVVLAFGLGLMAKSMLVTLPFVLLLLDYWPLGRFQWPRQSPGEVSPQSKSVSLACHVSSAWRLIIEKIPLFVLVAVSGVIALIAARDSTWNVSLNSRIANALVAYVSYIAKIIYPSRLAILYPLPLNGLPLWQPILCLVVLAAVTVSVIYTARRRPYLTVGWLWYLGTLVPVIGLVQVGIQAMADRYTYLPSIGIFIMTAWGAAELLAPAASICEAPRFASQEAGGQAKRRGRYRNIGLGISAGLLFAVLMICTRMQLRHWQNNFTLFGHALKVTKNNFVMHDSYGGALFEKGRFDQAVAHFSEALRINPQYLEARRNIGIVFLRQGKIDKAIMVFTDLLSSGGDWPKAHNYLALAYAQKGEFGLAVQNYNEALQLKPDYFEAIKNLGIALKEQGKINEAIKKWKKALQLKPDNPDVHYNMGLAMAEQYKYDEAIKHFNAASAAKPDWAEAYYNLGCIYYLQGKLGLAVQQCAEALRLKPDYHSAHYNMALAMTQQGKYDDAIKHFNEALAAKPDWPEAHYNLAGAYYQQGKLDLAVEQCTEVLSLKPDYLKARITLARILVEMGKIQPAVEQYYTILQIEPDHLYVLKNLAWVLATTKDTKIRNPAGAVKYAKRACELTNYKQPEALDTLAVAYAAAGRFGEAIETAEKAKKLAKAAGKKNLAQMVQKRLQLYKAGQLYRGPSPVKSNAGP